MSPIAEELDARLQTLDPESARIVECEVRDVLMRTRRKTGFWEGVPLDERGWPMGYFEKTAGALAGESFERPPQGELTQRDDW